MKQFLNGLASDVPTFIGTRLSFGAAAGIFDYPPHCGGPAAGPVIAGVKFNDGVEVTKDDQVAA